MASTSSLNTEIITDLEGNPLEAAASELIKALDRMLTVGAYYSSDHSQYIEVARKSCAAIVGAIQEASGHHGNRGVMAIEITATGMMISNQTVDPHHRHVRLLHDLIVPLNIAKLEISADLSAEDLRQALAALQEHKLALGSSNSFQEIKIENLPDTVRTVSCSVTSGGSSEGEDPGAGDDGGLLAASEDELSSLDVLLSEVGLEGGSGLEELVDAGSDPESKPGRETTPDPAARNPVDLARKFIDLVGKVIHNLGGPGDVVEESAEKPGDDDTPEFCQGTDTFNMVLPKDPGPDRRQGTVPASGHPDATPENLKEMADSLRRMAEANPDPESLLKMIEHAQSALTLSRNPDSVDMVFRMLRKEIRNGQIRAKGPVEKKPAPKPTMNVDQLRAHLVNLEETAKTEEADHDPLKSDYLGICFQILRSDPSESLETHTQAGIQTSLDEEGIEEEDVSALARAVAEVIDNDEPARAEQLTVVVYRALRKSGPAALGRFWLELWAVLHLRGRELVWPHLMNELLLGMDGVDSEDIKNMLYGLSVFDPDQADEMRDRLLELPAMKNRVLSREIFMPCPTRIGPLHALLLETPLGDALGPRLHDRLQRHPTNALAASLLRVLGPYRPEVKGFLAELVLQVGSEGEIGDELKHQALPLLVDGLLSLEPRKRKLGWVARAVSCLAQFDREEIEHVARRIQTQRKWFFFRAWPDPCRTAAERVVKSWNSDSAT